MKQRTGKQRPTFRQIYEASPMIQRNLATAGACLVLIVILTIVTIIVTLLEAKGIQ